MFLMKLKGTIISQVVADFYFCSSNSKMSVLKMFIELSQMLSLQQSYFQLFLFVLFALCPKCISLARKQFAKPCVPIRQNNSSCFVIIYNYLLTQNDRLRQVPYHHSVVFFPVL